MIKTLKKEILDNYLENNIDNFIYYKINSIDTNIDRSYNHFNKETKIIINNKYKFSKNTKIYNIKKQTKLNFLNYMNF